MPRAARISARSVVASNSILTVTPYERRYRPDLLALLEYSYQRHTHLDWYEPDEWVDNVAGLTRLAFRGTHLVGLMAATLPVFGASWIRMVALADGTTETEVLEQLWASTAAALRQAGTRECWVLMLEPWFEYYMPLLDMTEAERLVTLRREGDPLPERPPSRIAVEFARLEDVDAMTAVDQAAFATPFQMTTQDMRRAYRFAALSSVARVDGRIVGYQLSTRHGDQGHLARLAVSPSMQGQGIGAALVCDMTAALLRRRVELVTVNTQISNTRSLSLYTACGFTRSGFDLPIYRALL